MRRTHSHPYLEVQTETDRANWGGAPRLHLGLARRNWLPVLPFSTRPVLICFHSKRNRQKLTSEAVAGEAEKGR